MLTDDLAAVKARHPIFEVLDRLGAELPTRRLYNGDAMIRCPSPAHDDRTPSCIVHTGSGRFNCFGCGEHGDVIDLVLLVGGIRSFREAVDWLDSGTIVAASAPTAFSPLAASKEGPRLDRTARDRVVEVNRLAWQVFTAEPRRGPARRYLESRGIDIVALENHAGRALVGYPPAGRTGLASELRAAGVSEEEMMDAGWVIRCNGEVTDRLSRRVVFPIRDENDAIISYTARDITGRARAKYLNGPTSAAFVKGASLYAPLGFVQHRQVILCEGPLDTLALADDTGMEGGAGALPIAVLGTELTNGHAQLIARVRPQGVTVIADGDTAGQAASKRWVRTLLNAGVNATCVALALDADPASLHAATPENNVAADNVRGLTENLEPG